MAVVDERDCFTMRTPAPDYLAELEAGVKGVRVAWSPDYGRVVPNEPEVVSICHDLARTFRSLGADYSEPYIRIEDTFDPLEPDPEYSYAQAYARVREIKPDYMDPFTWISQLPREDYAKLSIPIRNRLERPADLDYPLSIKPSVRYMAKTRIEDLFERSDLLLSPTVASTSYVCNVETVPAWQYTAYTHIWNLTGCCGASIPAGFHNGMPVGLQIIARQGEEALLLRAARALERERPWAQNRPDIVLP
jgi:aspartyl-tRNA(Asn)/glutamyl-tRNA(Gln) amidotransferase subunit A